MQPILDKLGTPILVGSFIVYGHALGRCAGLRIGRVLGIKEKTHAYSTQRGAAIRVQGVNDDWGEPTLCKPGTLFFPSRIVVVTDLPEKIRKLFVDGN